MHTHKCPTKYTDMLMLPVHMVGHTHVPEHTHTEYTHLKHTHT